MTDVKVGQVWKSEHGRFHRIILDVDKKLVTKIVEGECCIGDIDVYDMPIRANHPCHTLVSDPDAPWLPLPDGYRLVTDEERAKYNHNRYAMWFDDDDDEWSRCNFNVWIQDAKYVIPCDHVWEWEEDKQTILPFALALNTNKEITNKINEIIAHINKEV